MSCRGVGFELTHQLLTLAHQPLLDAGSLRLVVGGGEDFAWHDKDYGLGALSESTRVKFWCMQRRHAPQGQSQRLHRDSPCIRLLKHRDGLASCIGNASIEPVTASDQVVNAAGGESMWPSIPPQLWGESIRGLDPQWRPHLLPDPLLQNACGSMVLFSASAFLQISRYLRCFPSSFHPSNVYEPWRFFVRTSDGNNRGHECALANTVPGATT